MMTKRRIFKILRAEIHDLEFLLNLTQFNVDRDGISARIYEIHKLAYKFGFFVDSDKYCLVGIMIAEFF